MARRSWLVGGAGILAVGAIAIALWSSSTSEESPPAPAPPVTAPPAPAPQMARPPPEPAPAPDREGGIPAAAFLDSEGEPTRALVLASLRASIEEHLPRYKLSSDEYEALADALLRMRAARRSIASATLHPDNAEALRALREELARAAADFEYVLEMSPAEFTARVQPGVGVDVGSDAPEIPTEEGASAPEFLHEIER